MDSSTAAKYCLESVILEHHIYKSVLVTSIGRNTDINSNI